MNYILFDDYSRENLLPLTFTRPTAEIRTGILTIREKWESYLQQSCSYLTKEYLSKKFPLKTEAQNILINGAVLPEENLIKQINKLQHGQKLVWGQDIIAANLNQQQVINFRDNKLKEIEIIEYQGERINKISYLWNIFQLNGWAIAEDFRILTKGRESAPLSTTNNILGDHEIFVEPGANVEHATLNTSKGPVYIGKNAEIMEGSVIRGPLAMCEHSVLKISSKIYGPSTLGPYCKVGGEVKNSVMTGFSNKAHEGFLGNSVVGEWCNLGASTNNSNLKNNYGEVKLWNYPEEKFLPTGLQFCGFFMGDHSKCGINTMFNTGTIVGVSSNIFGEGFQRNFIPSFTWGGTNGYDEYRLVKALEVAGNVMKRRNIKLDSRDQQILTDIFHQTQKFRK